MWRHIATHRWRVSISWASTMSLGYSCSVCPRPTQRVRRRKASWACRSQLSMVSGLIIVWQVCQRSKNDSLTGTSLAIGNIIGTQFFLQRQAPHYVLGIGAPPLPSWLRRDWHTTFTASTRTSAVTAYMEIAIPLRMGSLIWKCWIIPIERTKGLDIFISPNFKVSELITYACYILSLLHQHPPRPTPPRNSNKHTARQQRPSTEAL
jgi:hypothetical protein